MPNKKKHMNKLAPYKRSSKLSINCADILNFKSCLRGVKLENTFGPSEVHATSRANLGRPPFWVFIPLLLFLAAVTKIPEGFVVGFQIFAWAPK